jgi:hypothetical protein
MWFALASSRKRCRDGIGGTVQGHSRFLREEAGSLGAGPRSDGALGGSATRPQGEGQPQGGYGNDTSQAFDVEVR